MDMDMDRMDYALMKFLKSNSCVGFFNGMTEQEIMDKLGSRRSTTYRKLIRLIGQGYVEKGCKDINADTYCITDKGIKLVEQSEKELKGDGDNAKR